jgi:hypothetical protein
MLEIWLQVQPYRSTNFYIYEYMRTEMAVTSSGSTAEWDQVGWCCPGKNEAMSRSEQLSLLIATLVIMLSYIQVLKKQRTENIEHLVWQSLWIWMRACIDFTRRYCVIAMAHSGIDITLSNHIHGQLPISSGLTVLMHPSKICQTTMYEQLRLS